MIDLHRWRLVPYLMLCLLLFASPLAAQEATPAPDSTGEITPEATTEATAEATPDPLASLPPGRYDVTVASGNYERTYLLEVSASYYVSTAPAPLIFVLHGAGSRGADMAAISGFSEIAEQEGAGALVVYPDGLGGAWNDGRPNSGFPDDLDDVAYLTQIAETLTRRMRVDAARVYAVGYSMGGMMSFRLGCQAGDVFAAVGSVASTMPLYLVEECDAAPPVPVIVLQGTDDQVIPWIGIRGAYQSAADTVAYWIEHNGCTVGSNQDVLEDVDPEDSTRVVVQQYTLCEEDADFTLYGIYGSGHTWPGNVRGSIGGGVTSYDISGAAVLWGFFAAHRLESARSG